MKRLHARLVERGFSAVALSGELTQSERTHALQALRDGRARVLVATDVAARGLDLPDLGSRHPRRSAATIRETLLHRSGRTGRAGNKGLCMLIVPYNRRRKAEALLAGAKLKVTWSPAPTAEEIRARDQERFLAERIFTDAATEEDLALARCSQGGAHGGRDRAGAGAHASRPAACAGGSGRGYRPAAASRRPCTRTAASGAE